MSRIFRAGVYIFAVISAVVVSLMVFGFTMRSGVVTYMAYDVMNIHSPDSLHVITVQNDTCAASGELQTVARLSAQYSDTGAVIFKASSTKQDAGSFSPISLKVTWQSDDAVEIAFPRGIKSDSQFDTFDGVQVHYKQVSLP